MLKIVRQETFSTRVDALVVCAKVLPAEGIAIARAAKDIAAKWVINAVEPKWRGGNSGEIQQLRECYRETLGLANEHECNSIAIPLIAANQNGFPKEVVLAAAIGEIEEFLAECDMDVWLVVQEWQKYVASGIVFGDIENYPEEDFTLGDKLCCMCAALPAIDYIKEYTKTFSAEERRARLRYASADIERRSFPEILRELMWKKSITPRDFQKRISDKPLLSKQLVHKILSSRKTVQLSKDTMFKLCYVLRLNGRELRRFLSYADLALNPLSLRDGIIASFFDAEDWHPVEIDLALYGAGLPLLFDLIG